MCFGCSKEPSHLDGYFEHSQHMFWITNMEKIFFQYALLSGALLTLIVILISCGFQCFVALSRGAVDWSAVCECDIS